MEKRLISWLTLVFASILIIAAIIYTYKPYVHQNTINDTAPLFEVDYSYINNVLNTCDDKKHMTLKAISENIGITNERNKGYFGKGITIAIIDSGVFPHPDLVSPKNRIIAFKDFVNSIDFPYDDDGHGTMMAGIIAGNGLLSNGISKGIAPLANIVGIKVVDSYGQVNIDHVIKAFEWVLQNKEKYNIKIINMSIGFEVNNSIKTKKLMSLVEKSKKSNLLVVCAAGNKSVESEGISLPAGSKDVIAVGAIAKKEVSSPKEYKVASFTRTFKNKVLKKPDVVTYGEDIVSLDTDIWYIPYKNKGSNKKISYVSSSGTSQSAAVISGILAVLSDHYNNLSADEIQNILYKNCIKIDDDITSQGRGFVYVSK